MSESARVVLVGCGAVAAELYVPSLRPLAKSGVVSVRAVVDLDIARAHAVARHFPGASAHASVEAAIVPGTVDLAIIASPPAVHMAQSIAALDRQAHVLCEKPLARSGDECESMLAAADRSGRRIFVGLPRRLFPVLQEIRAFIRDGTLGSTLSFSYREGGRYTWPVASMGALRRESSGGGVLMDKGSHALDVLVQIFGPPSEWSYFDDAMASGIETNCLIEWRAPSLAGTVTLSWDQDLGGGLCVHGDKGALQWDPGEIDRCYLRVNDAARQAVISTTQWHSATDDRRSRMAQPRNYFDCMSLQLVQVLRALRHGGASPLDAGSAVASVAMIADCYAHARPLSQPWLSDDEQQAAVAQHWAVMA